MKEPDT